MRLVADENIDGQIVELLRSDGHEVLYIAESHSSIGDRDVPGESLQTDALLVTADKDFGELVFREGLPHAGILLIRMEGLDSADKAALVASAIRTHGEAMCRGFSVLTPRTFRLRKLIQ